MTDKTEAMLLQGCSNSETATHLRSLSNKDCCHRSSCTPRSLPLTTGNVLCCYAPRDFPLCRAALQRPSPHALSASIL